MCELLSMNKLQAYLEQSELRPSDLAAAVGTSRGYISDLLSGRRLRPGLTVAAAIERATKGAVPAASWVASREHNTVAHCEQLPDETIRANGPDA